MSFSNHETNLKNRSGGRIGNFTRRKRSLINQMPWRLPINVDAPIEPIDESGLHSIHDGGDSWKALFK